MQRSVGGTATHATLDENATDRLLVEAVVAGDTTALTILHGRYYTRLYRLAYVRCRNAQDAEDVTSETFIRAIRHLNGYRFQGDSLFPYLARIAANLIVDQSRRSRGMSFVSLDGGGASEAVRTLLESLPSDPASDPQQLAERQEVRALVRAAIVALPADQADAILLRFGGDLPLKEIALSLNKTEGAIKSLLHRALANLRRSLTSGESASAVFGRSSTTTMHKTTQATPETTATSALRSLGREEDGRP
jgi:RNA polymerase sigma-70 factor (ECF subfamily)